MAISKSTKTTSTRKKSTVRKTSSASSRKPEIKKIEDVQIVETINNVTPMVEENKSEIKESTSSSTMSLVERISKRMVEQVSVRHLNPNVCILTLDKSKGKMGEKVFQGYQSRLISIGELMEIAPNTKLFTGSDGKGTNAPLYIEDAEVREYLGFGENQKVLTKDKILEILEEPDKNKFEESIDMFKNDITKINLLRDMIVTQGYNDAQRIKYIEKVLDIEINF